MSRWDALRPERRECVPRKSFGPRPSMKLQRTPDDASLNWQRQVTKLTEATKERNETNIIISLESLEEILDSGANIQRKSAGDAVTSLLASDVDSRVVLSKRIKLASRILSKQKVILSNRQVKQCVDNLMGMSEPDRVESMARFVLVASRQMPAEETANDIVGGIFLPALEKQDPSEHIVVVLSALQCLVSDSLHASALLAPLTVDVSEQGQEETFTNPLRSRLMRAIQSLLSMETYSYAACTCLVGVIKTTTPGGDATELNVASLKTFFAGAAREQSGEARQDKAFELLKLLVKVYPSTSTALSALLIGDGRFVPQSSGSTCVHCRHEATSPLLDLLHECNDDALSTVIPCIQELLIEMPLNLWLGEKSRGLQHFGRRASSALARLMRIVQCRIKQRPSLIPSLCPLVEVSLTRIPYSENSKDDLTREAIDLLVVVSTGFRRMRQCTELLECFEGSMGGRTQPQGGVSKMLVPMRLWLSSKLSEEFREYLWTSLESKSYRREEAMKVLCSIVRSLPSYISRDNTTFKRFEDLITVYSKVDSPSIRLDGGRLLEAFLAGRMERNEACDRNESTALLTSSIALKMLLDPNPQLQIMGLNCYGCLLANDWLVLSQRAANDERPGFQQQVDAILAHCTISNEDNAGVRSVACKCIGSTCTRYISGTNREEGGILVNGKARMEFCATTSKTLLVSLQDPSAAVRSMAVFAVGNLAHALRDGTDGNQVLLPPADIQPLCGAVNECLHGTNGKLVNNAIRTIGHLVSLGYNPPYIDSGVIVDQDVRSSVFSSVLRGLNGKVEAALELEAYQYWSWKRRSNTSKHAWGACNSLSLVLNCGMATKTENLKLAQHSLGLLIQCINRAESLHEKVASSATASVRKVAESTLARISDESGTIGMALAPCLIQLYQIKIFHRQGKVRLNHELSLLLRHLLRAATISDACFLIKQQDTGKEVLEYLYDWMVEEDMPLVSFESFALALQRKDLIDDAGLQMKFASRALQLHRNASSDDNDEL